MLAPSGRGRKAHFLEDKQIPSVGVFDECGDGVASIKRRRRDLSSEDVRELTTASGRNQLKSNLEYGDGIASIKRCCRDLSSDGARELTTASGRNRLKSDLEDSTS
ncbi:hypothetical protein Tco_0003049 [Tanacetum coccineum]